MKAHERNEAEGSTDYLIQIVEADSNYNELFTSTLIRNNVLAMLRDLAKRIDDA